MITGLSVFESASSVDLKSIDTLKSVDSPHPIEITSNENGSKIVIQNESLDEYVLSYNKQTSILHSDLLNHSSSEVDVLNLELKYISNIEITNLNNTIKCEFFYSNYP